MSKSKRSQQRYASSWIGQTRLDEFFSGSSTRSQQPIEIDIDAASDTGIESDIMIEFVDSETALDLDEPRSPGCWCCRSLIWPSVDKIYTENFAQKFGAAKKRGNKMKAPFLSSFCPSGFRSVVRFSLKNLVPEIIN
jgi:hypothetical protein